MGRDLPSLQRFYDCPSLKKTYLRLFYALNKCTHEALALLTLLLEILRSSPIIRSHFVNFDQEFPQFQIELYNLLAISQQNFLDTMLQKIKERLRFEFNQQIELMKDLFHFEEKNYRNLHQYPCFNALRKENQSVKVVRKFLLDNFEEDELEEPAELKEEIFNIRIQAYIFVARIMTLMDLVWNLELTRSEIDKNQIFLFIKRVFRDILTKELFEDYNNIINDTLLSAYNLTNQKSTQTKIFLKELKRIFLSNTFNSKKKFFCKYFCCFSKKRFLTSASYSNNQLPESLGASSEKDFKKSQELDYFNQGTISELQRVLYF